MVVLDGRLLGDDDKALAMVEYIVKSALEQNEQQVRYWTTTLVEHLWKDDLTRRTGDRIYQTLQNSKGKPVVLDDVIPIPAVDYPPDKNGILFNLDLD